MDEPPPPVVAGQLKEHPDGQFRKTASLEFRQDHPADLGIGAPPASSCDHNVTDPATTSGAASSGTIILIHASPAEASLTSRATLSSMPSRGSGPPSSAIMTGSHRILT